MSRRFLVLLFTGLLAQAAPIIRHAFRTDGALTGPSGLAPRSIAEAYTREQMQQAGIEAAGLYLEKEYKTQHNGVTHLVYRQRFQGLDISGAEWVVNVDRDGQILNAGGKLYNPPADGLRPPSSLTMRSAARKAAIAVNPVLAAEANISQAGLNHRAELRFSTGGAMGEITGRPVWYPVRGELQPAWEFVVTDGDGISTYETVIDARTEMVLAKESMTKFQSARGSVFTGMSPQPTLKYGVASTTPPPYVERESVAFPPAWIDGTETAGNNTITGYNPRGVLHLETPVTAKAPNRDFKFPLAFDSAPSNFVDSATTNLFYWVNRAHDLYYSIGFDEAAGNYQTHNFGKGGIGGDPMYAYAHFGAQSPTGFANLNNAFFTTRGLRDGEPSMIAMFLTFFGPAWADGSLAADVIVHEYTHGVTFRLVRSAAGFQGGALHEAISEFFSLEWIVPEGANPDGVYPASEYWSQSFGVGTGTRPYSTNLEINPLTFRDLGRATAFPEVHADGEIWTAALWDARANLIRQFGEREGRKRIRQIVIDGMKLSPPTPSMVDMRDAILLADRVDYKGESQSQLWEAFARRGLGALAYSANANSINVTASFEKPSTTGSIGVLEEVLTVGEPLRILVNDTNNDAPVITVDVTSSSGDVETVRLVRQGTFYNGLLPTTSAGPARRNTGALSVLRGDAITIYYNDFNTGAGPRLIEKTIATNQNYAIGSALPGNFTFPNERLLSRRGLGTGGFDRFTLPFDFPFFNRSYREVRVLPEGYLQFDIANFPSCLDPATFSHIAAIAPMATWMRTNGGAQPNEGVYVSTGPNTVTFRWAGETQPLVNAPPFTPPPSPVNFAVTLHENGEIRFHYGAGNSNIVNTASFSCNAITPFVGISRGAGTGAIAPALGLERSNFAGAPTLEFYPPFGHASAPQGRLDTPVADASVDGPLTVRGVVFDLDISIISATVVIDGIHEGAAALTAAPAGTCPPNTPRCDARTFARSFDPTLLNLKPGPHTVQIRAVNAKGAFTDLLAAPRTFTISDSPAPLPKLVIESPAATEVWKEDIILRGYAYSTRSRITQLDVLIDNIAYGRGFLGQPRADICAGEAAGSPNCPGIGWAAFISTQDPSQAILNGDHTLQMRVTEESGRVSLHPETPMKFKVDNVSPKPPVGVVTSPTNAQKVSGTITISGHGWDPDGRVRTVILLIDDVSRATLRYGLPRPEACASLSGVTACPNIGFEGTFDTKLLRNGPHRLGVALIDDSDQFTVIPAITPAGMNITVEN